MTTAIQIPGHGYALAGLDWLALPGLDGKHTEIRQLGRGVQAAWQYVWSEENESYVAFVSKSESKTRPIAAPVLIREVTEGSTYLIFINIGAAGTWLFAVKDGLPVKRMDRVDDPMEVIAQARDFLAALPDSSAAPIYTDQPECFQGLPFKVDMRQFSLDVLGYSIKKRTLAKAAFRRYSNLPVGMIAVALVALIALGTFLLYQQYAQRDAQKRASLERKKNALRKAEALATHISESINGIPSAKVAIPSYLNALAHVPLHLAGWHLSDILCQNTACHLTFKGGHFATWQGYAKKKPTQWPAPILGTDIQRIEQMIPVELPAVKKRTLQTLPQRQQLVYELGNLAQIAKPVGIMVTLENRGTPVVNETAHADIPLKAGYMVTGAATVLESFSQRLPDAASVVSLTLQMREKTTFNIKGEAYALP